VAKKRVRNRFFGCVATKDVTRLNVETSRSCIRDAKSASERWEEGRGRREVKVVLEEYVGGTPYTPGISYECQNKGVARFAFCNCMKKKEILGQWNREIAKC
jgi:hypothetical protein